MKIVSCLPAAFDPTTKKNALVRGLCVLLSAGILLSCNSSKITSSWGAGKTLNADADKIIVIALVPADQREMAEQLEKHLANDLSGMGYQAVSAFDVYGPLAFCPGNDTIVYEQLREKGITAVLTVALVDKQVVEKIIPGHYVHPAKFMDYVGPKYALLYEPAHVEIHTNYFWETRVYNVTPESLLYFSQTTSLAAPAVKTMAHEYGRKITRNMIKRKIIAPVIPDLE